MNTHKDGLYVLESRSGMLMSAVGFLSSGRIYLNFRDAYYDSGDEYSSVYMPGRLIEAIDFSEEIK